MDDWTPFQNRTEFETADFLYRRNQMSASDIDTLLDLWASSLLKYNDHPLFADHNDLVILLIQSMLAISLGSRFQPSTMAPSLKPMSHHG
jgi:hypothetical protein